MQDTIVAEISRAIISELVTNQRGLQHGQTGPECVDVNSSDILDVTAIAEAIVTQLGLKKQTVWNRADGRDGYVYQTDFVQLTRE